LTAVKAARGHRRYTRAMDDFPIDPPIEIKDTPRPRRLTTLGEARDYIDEALRVGRPPAWRELWHRIKSVTTEDEAIEAIGEIRELFTLEDLLVAPLPGPTTQQA
jgi:hypothetical protein